MGFSLAIHYCGGIAVERTISIGHADLGCGMADMERDCENTPGEGNQLQKQPCCQDEYQSLDQDIDYERIVANSNFNPEFLAAFLFAYLDIAPHDAAQLTKYHNYSPPLIEHDIPVMVQSFLL